MTNTGSTPTTRETSGSKERASESRPALIVTQPERLGSLLETLTLLDTVSERMGEDRSGDLGGGGQGATRRGDDDTQQSLRSLAIQNLPEPPQMRREIKRHIEREVNTLRREVRRIARRASKPGAAHKLNVLYARIRRLNGLLAEILEAGLDILRRFYIRVFVDKQSIV